MLKKRSEREAGVITVEACTSLVIFILVFYIVLEMMKVFAIESGCQELMTNMVLDASVSRSYVNKYEYDYDGMDNLKEDDFQGERYESVTGYGYYILSSSNLENYLDESSYLYKLIERGDVECTSFYVERYGEYVVACGIYEYTMMDVPFLENNPLRIRMYPKVYTKTWKASWEE